MNKERLRLTVPPRIKRCLVEYYFRIIICHIRLANIDYVNCGAKSNKVIKRVRVRFKRVIEVIKDQPQQKEWIYECLSKLNQTPDTYLYGECNKILGTKVKEISNESR